MLDDAAIEVNQVFNWANETSFSSLTGQEGEPKRLSAYDLDKLAAGCSNNFDRIGSDTIQRINAEYARRRNQFRKLKLRWRKSFGSRRSLGWIPFKAVQLKRKGQVLRFSGKAFRVFEQDKLKGVRWRCGCFAQDAVGGLVAAIAAAFTTTLRCPATVESAPGRNRTCDLALRRHSLYPLSYRGQRLRPETLRP